MALSPETAAPFLRTLVEDVIAAFDGLDGLDSASAKRNAIRTAFAAVDGLVWQTREQVRSISLEMSLLTPLVDMALREQNYNVRENGEVVEQVRYVTITASIRLTIRQAQILAPALTIDFSEGGWEQFRTALQIRHRITHPKSLNDLSIGSTDITLTKAAFMWLFDLMSKTLEAAVEALRLYAHDAREIVDRLEAGDPIVLRAHREALKDLRDE